MSRSQVWGQVLGAEWVASPRSLAARSIGGLCSRSLHFAGGRTLEEMLLHHALGEPVNDLSAEAQASGVMMLPIPRTGIMAGLEHRASALAVAGIDDDSGEFSVFVCPASSVNQSSTGSIRKNVAPTCSLL